MAEAITTSQRARFVRGGSGYDVRWETVNHQGSVFMRNGEENIITNIEWGRMVVEVNGETRHFKDCKVWPGGAREWDWDETGTRHEPGIQPADIEEILEKEVEIMILTRGQQLRLQTKPETEALLKERGIEYHIEETKEAVALFNQYMRQGRFPLDVLRMVAGRRPPMVESAAMLCDWSD